MAFTTTLLPPMPDDTATAALVDPRESLRTALHHLEIVQAQAQPWAMADAHRAVASAYRALDALPSATALLEVAIRWARAAASVDQEVDLLCEAVEVLAQHADALERQERGRGRPDRERARDLVFEATRLAPRVADPRWEVMVLLRLSDVLDRFGDRDDATTLQIRALQLTVGVSPAGPAERSYASSGSAAPH